MKHSKITEATAKLIRDRRSPLHPSLSKVDGQVYYMDDILRLAQSLQVSVTDLMPDPGALAKGIVCSLGAGLSFGSPAIWGDARTKTTD
jgi:hypothetical protein